MKKKMFVIFLTLVFSVLTATAILSGTAGAKSLYTIAAINADPTPVEAYDIKADGSLSFQKAYGVPSYSGGAVGIGVDSDSATLFVTYEFTNVIQLLDATTMGDLGTTTAPSASNLAGIVVDQDKGLLYTVDRWTDDLYIYQWYPSNTTLVLQSTQDLSDAPSSFGIALDEVNDILYVANYYSSVMYYDTNTWAKLGEFTVSHYPQSIAVDTTNQFVYTGGGWGGSTLLSKYDLITTTETTADVGEGVLGVAVDSATSLIYCNIGIYIGSASTIQVFDSDLTQLFSTFFNYSYPSPTGLCIPGKDISYNPLNLSKDDGRLEEECVYPGDNINYNICFDNELNEFDVTNVTINDTLPPEVNFVSATDGGIYDAGTHTVFWDMGTISAGGTEQCISLIVEVKLGTAPETMITNYVTIESDETPPTTQSEETLACEESGEDFPPMQTIELGTPLMEDVYNTGLEWLDLIGSQTSVWINSSDAETGTDFIKYKLFKSDVFGSWDDPAWVYVYDNQQTGNPFTSDADSSNGSISIQFYIEESCFHEIHAHCVDTVGNWNFSEPFDFLVDFDAPSNDDFTYIDSYLLPGGARYINNQSIKRIFANDTGCTGGVAGVDRIIWRIENNKTQIIAEGIIYDNNDTGYEDANVSVSGDLDDTEGKMIIDIQLNEECMHFIYHQAIDKLENKVVGLKQLVYVDLTPPTIFKTVGDPNCTIVTGEEYCITPDTPITFYAEDRGCMGGVGLDTVEYNIWYQGDWTGWMLLEEELQNESLYLTEECMHYLLIRATDILGNEFEDNETFYVDTTAPIIEKTVGDPNCTLNCKSLKLPLDPVTMSVVLGTDSYFITTLSNVPLGYDVTNGDYIGWCVDQDHSINHSGKEYSVVLWCSYDPSIPWLDDDWDMVNYIINHKHPDATKTDIQEAIWYFVNGGNDPSTDIGQSMVENATNFGEGFMPSIGEWCAILCDAGEDAQKVFIEVLVPDRYCVTTDTNITLDAVDLGCCPSGEVTIEYRIWYLGTWTNWMNYTGNITLSGECIHYLEARAYDCLGNLGEIDNETFYVDETPPEIIKTVGDPNCTGCGEMGDDDYCVTTDTFITLEAVEQGCCPSEGVTIEYKIGDGNWIEYIEPFNFTEECEHILLVRAYDCLGNGMDEMYWDNETFYVDETPPEIIKTVGDPNCTGCGEMGDDDYCVTTDTLITLDAVDLGCCPCTNVTIEYQIAFYDGEVWVWTDWINYTEPFNFTEECEHQLYVRAYDCLGNGLDCGYWDIEIFYVDDTPPPKPEKTVGDPKAKLVNSSTGEEQWIIFPETEINFTGYPDEGCCPCEEVTIEYRIWYLGTWTDWTIYTGNITISTGCVHYLEARAYDCLGNRGEIDNETFWVCGPSGDSGPDIAFIEPAFGETRCDRTLEVIIDASDDETTKEDLTVIMWIPPTGNAPTLYYYPEYDPVTYGDEYFHAFIDIYKYQDGTHLTLQAFAQDEDMNTEMTIPYQFTVCSTIEYDQWMQKGWNILTLPPGAIACNNSLEKALFSIYGDFDLVFYYDVPTDDWDSWVEGRDEIFNDLTEIYSGKTYFINITKAGGIRYYSDIYPPIVIIDDPEDGSVKDGMGNANIFAYDDESWITDVYAEIYDQNDSLYYNGSGWQSGQIWLICNYTGGDEWTYDTDDIWTNDHIYTLAVMAYDAGGCTGVDSSTFTIQPED